jgi:hypothetical protein
VELAAPPRKQTGCLRESSPGEFRPEPLAEPDANLSIHPAPIRRTHRSYIEGCVCRMHRVHPVSSCFAKCDRLTRPLCSSPITEPSLFLRVGPSQFSASVLLPCGFGRLGFSLNIGPTGSCSSVPSPASASRPLYAGRHLLSHQAPSRVIPGTHYAPGFDNTGVLNDASSKVHFRSSLGCTPAQVFLALFLQRTLPTALDGSSLEVV